MKDNIYIRRVCHNQLITALIIMQLKTETNRGPPYQWDKEIIKTSQNISDGSYIHNTLSLAFNLEALNAK